MTDVTAQTFREAAAQAQRFDYPAWAELLLAAAEHCEQLERVLNAIHPKRDASWSTEQLATLAEAHRDDSDFADSLEEDALDYGKVSLHRREQIATLTAEREALRAELTTAEAAVSTLMTKLTQAEAERDAALVKLAAIRARAEDTGSIDTFRVIQILNAPTRPA